MGKMMALFLCLVCTATLLRAGSAGNTPDTIATAQGKLIVHCLGHASLRFEYGGLNIYVDPVARSADYSQMPKADIILVTHEHGDHLDGDVIRGLSGKNTQSILNASSRDILKSGTAMANGESKKIDGISIEAVPAYNTTPGHEDFHPRGRDNGYILTMGGKRIYIAGDTENTPEMKSLKNIDIAFLPMNLPWTMSPEQVADAVKAFRPKILYPYHTGETDVSKLVALLKDVKGIDVRIKNMK